jgi:recombination protein RecR
MSRIEPVEKLMAVLGRLPGIGRRTAERMAVKLARDPQGLTRELGAALADLAARVTICSKCGDLTLRGTDPCALCTSPRRDSRVLCVVEDPGDVQQIESSGAFQGRYHALLGRLSPMRGEGPGHLRLEALLKRIEEENISEVILALSPDVEGDSTAAFIRHLLESRSGLRVTRLALGMPAGSAIAYADPLTLARALQGRQNM